jgi:ACR3 family arsenite transporter
MIVMMWPALTKVQYEKLPRLFTTKALWEQLIISLVINWIIGPFVSIPFTMNDGLPIGDEPY